MHRKTRSKKLLAKQYHVRTKTTDIVSHFIIYPVVPSIIGNGNDFFMNALSLCMNGKKLKNNTRCQQFFRGFYLTHPIETSDLITCSETGWFTSYRSEDLEKIGKVAGYFIRQYSVTIAQALDQAFVPECYPPIQDDKFNQFVKSFKDKKTIVPAVVQIQISRSSKFDVGRFTVVKANDLITDDEDQVQITRNVTLHFLKPEKHAWAWNLLQNSNSQEEIKFVESISISENLAVSTPCTTPLSVDLSPPFDTDLPTPSPSTMSIIPQSSSALPAMTKMKTRREGRRVEVIRHSKKSRRSTRKDHSTRSKRSTTIPLNTTFAWVSLKGCPSTCRPSLIHSPSAAGKFAMAQLITTAGDLCMTLHEVSVCTEESIKKSSAYKTALRKFNSLYTTNFE